MQEEEKYELFFTEKFNFYIILYLFYVQKMPIKH